MMMLRVKLIRIGRMKMDKVYVYEENKYLVEISQNIEGRIEEFALAVMKYNIAKYYQDRIAVELKDGTLNIKN